MECAWNSLRPSPLLQSVEKLLASETGPRCQKVKDHWPLGSELGAREPYTYLLFFPFWD